MTPPSPTAGEPEWTWRAFDRAVRPRGEPLLARLPAFHDAVLVGGCQRSGTTMVADILAASDGLEGVGADGTGELDAALILSGEVAHEPRRRSCLQTTYLDDRWREYLEAEARFRLVWCVRNPHAVVASMLYHWAPFALMDTFRRCGVERLSAARRALHRALGIRTVRPVHRACLVYASKVSQTLPLKAALGDAMLVVDYDALLASPNERLARIYDFIDVPYRPEYAASIDTGRAPRAVQLSAPERRAIHRICGRVYDQARHFVAP